MQEGEIEVPFVRGATSKDGRNFKITVYYAEKKEENLNPEDEDGSFDLHYNWTFSESQFKRRKLQINNEKVLRGEFVGLVEGHDQRSRMFKPEISTMFPIISVMRNNEVLWGGIEGINFGGQKYIPRDPILKEGEIIFNFGEEAKNGHNSHMNLYFISDGRRAFVKRLD